MKVLKKQPSSGLANKLFGRSIFLCHATFLAQNSMCRHPMQFTRQTLLFLPHDKLRCGCKVYKYALTVVIITSHFKESEPLSSEDSAEVAKAFQSIYRPLTWSQMLQFDPGHKFMGNVNKEMKNSGLNSTRVHPLHLSHAGHCCFVASNSARNSGQTISSGQSAEMAL